MKLFNKIPNEIKISGGCFIILVGFVAVMAAGVNGIFNNVTASGFINSTSGYKVNSAAGSSGQALCSDGTYFDTPCTPSGTGISALTGPVTASGTGSVASTITATGVTAGSYVSPNVTINAAGQITAASSAFTSGNNGNGYWTEDPSGLIRQWGTIIVVGAGAPGPYSTFSFPKAFATTNYSISGNANATVSGADATTSGDIPILIFDDFSTAGARWRLDSNKGDSFGTVSFRWIAIGY